MCCFSPLTIPLTFWARLLPRPRIKVAGTRIFGRMVGTPERPQQLLVYSMTLSTPADVAMLLPIPIPAGAGEDALRFIDLEPHPRFFDDIHELFEPMLLARKGGLSLPRLRPTLVVHQVGAFSASFVPSVDDFDRVDERFRLPPSIWHELGDYEGFGFAVFQLDPGKGTRIHPMAMRFEARTAEQLYFPTVHVHDGRVHPTATFDHVLYWQYPRQHPRLRGVPYQPHPEHFDELSMFPPTKDVQGLLDEELLVARRRLRGRRPNRDTYVELT